MNFKVEEVNKDAIVINVGLDFHMTTFTKERIFGSTIIIG